MKISQPTSIDLKQSTMQADTDKETKLKEACKDFEAIFLKQMLTTMRKSVPKGGLFNEGFASDMYQSMSDEQIANKMAHSNRGMGVADVLYKQISGQIKSELPTGINNETK